MSVAARQSRRSPVSNPSAPDGPPPLRNADCPWDLFDSDAYLRRNYLTMHDLDRAIIERLAEFFASKAPTKNWHGIDVGSGTNLYPALAMLPLAETVLLWEHSAANVRWLEHGIRPYGQVWDPFWEALAASAGMYQRFRRPRSLLPMKAKVEKASVFGLPEQEWDIGTMFFVAESITGVKAEFELATTKFVRSLKPGAPFAAAFMRDSRGYDVGGQRFPAVAVVEQDVSRLLRGIAVDVEIHSIGSTQQLREGHDGMILATGTRGDRGSGARRRGRRGSS